MFYGGILHVLLAAMALAERTFVEEALLQNLVRYAYFSSAAYSHICKHPPFDTTVEMRFSDMMTDTQVTLFRDDSTKEYILAFRGTSSILDLVTDFRKALVDCTPAIGEACQNCTVSRLSSLLATIANLRSDKRPTKSVMLAL